MTAQTGRTNAKHIQVFIDNVSDVLTEITAYVNNIGQVGLNFDSQDVTAFSDGSKNIVIGQPAAPLKIGGPFDTVLHAIMIALDGRATPLSFDIRIGIRHAWEAGEPQFGLTSTASVGYLVKNYMVDMAANTWSADLDVFGATSPLWGTAAET